MLIVAAAGFATVNLADPTPKTALGAPHFVDETDSSGIEHVYDGDAAFATGGGVAAFDCDGSGKPALYLAGGSQPAALYRNESAINGPLKFTRLADPATDLVGVLGAYPIDLYGEGFTDLVVLRKGQLTILRGLGNCRFEPAEDWLTSALTTAFSAKWDGTNQLPTLAVGNYLKLDSAGKLTQDCSDNAIVRPNANGSTYAQPLVLSPGFCALSMLFSDWDRSGRRDLRVTNDRQYYINGQDQLWRIASDEPPRLYTQQDGWESLQIWGMGIASHDLVGDGYPAVFLTSMGDNKLQVLTTGPARPTYRDIALRRGVTAAQPFTGGDARPSTAWHAEFEDVNNDGFIDLFVSKGNVSTMPEAANKDPSDLFLGQSDGTFKEAADAAGVLNFARGRGAVLADLNLSGMLDLVEVNYGDRVRVWRNVGGGDANKPSLMGNWLGVRLNQPGANRDAIGAWLEVQVGKTTLRHELTIGGGHAGGQLGWIHFGLGAANNVQVRVQWPDGELGAWQSAAANQFIVIERGASQVRAWRPPGA